MNRFTAAPRSPVAPLFARPHGFFQPARVGHACFTWLLGALLLCAVTGCGSTPRPRTELLDVSLGEVTSEAGVLVFEIQLDNDHQEPLKLEEFRYELKINGASVYHGRRAAEATLSANGGKAIRLPVVVPQPILQQGGEALAYDFTARVWYRMPGELREILYDAGLHRPSVTFGASGRLEGLR